MKTQFIKLIRNQLEKLNSKDFDLDAWKNSTILVLERVFGKDNLKSKKIQEIHYDLSSWSLRDTLGTSAHFDACKKNGREILEVCLMELETLGVPDKEDQQASAIDIDIINHALGDEMKISQFRELQKLFNQSDQEVREQVVYDFLMQFGSEPAIRILAKILSHPDMVNKIKPD